MAQGRGKPIQPTAAGTLLFRYTERMMSLAADAVAAAKDLQEVRMGTMYVGASQTTGVYMMPKLIGDTPHLLPVCFHASPGPSRVSTGCPNSFPALILRSNWAAPAQAYLTPFQIPSELSVHLCVCFFLVTPCSCADAGECSWLQRNTDGTTQQ